LITLGIIGVVAAITIPILVGNYQKKVTVERLKAAYTTLAQAIQLSENDNGPVSDWEFPTGHGDPNNFLDRYIMPYLQKIGQVSTVTQTEEYSMKTIDGRGSSTGQWRILSNGTAIMQNTGSTYAWIFIDINGLKGPNRYGKDIFMTELYTKKKLLMGWGISDRDALINDSVYGCKKGENLQYGGANCGNLIQLDGWRISDDYPW